MRGPVDRVSIVAGVAVTALGVLLLLDQAGTLDLQFDYAAPAVLATVGVVLLALGLSPRPRAADALAPDDAAAPRGAAPPRGAPTDDDGGPRAG